MTEKELMELWATLSRKVLACIMVDDGAVFPVMEIVKNNARWFHPQESNIYRAVLQCVEANVPPTVEAVISRTDKANSGYIQSVANLFNDDDNRHLVYNAEQLKELGIWANIRQLGKSLSEVKSPKEIDQAVGDVTTGLAGAYADKNDRDPSAASVDAAAWADVENFSGKAIPTGMGWYDQMGGGLWPGMNYWLVAPYKSGKSTLMRNWVLSATFAKHPVSVFVAEGTRELFALDCQAMIAARLMYTTYSDIDLRLSGMFILNSWLKHKKKPVFTDREYTAITEARKLWAKLPVRVYDTIDSVRNLTTLHYIIKRDRLRYGTQAAYLDYSQLFGAGKTIFEQQRTTSLRLQEIAQDEKIALVILAQKNEESVRSAGVSYSPGVKGGGDAAATADGLFITEIDQDRPEVMKVTLKLARHTPKAKGAFKIDPASGFILKELQIRELE